MYIYTNENTQIKAYIPKGTYMITEITRFEKSIKELLAEYDCKNVDDLFNHKKNKRFFEFNSNEKKICFARRIEINDVPIARAKMQQGPDAFLKWVEKY